LALGFRLIHVVASGITKHANNSFWTPCTTAPIGRDFAFKENTLFEDLDGQLALVFEPPRWLRPQVGSGASCCCCFLKLVLHAIIARERSLRKESDSENNREKDENGAKHDDLALTL
jgi:hypothetical protein